MRTTFMANAQSMSVNGTLLMLKVKTLGRLSF